MCHVTCCYGGHVTCGAAVRSDPIWRRCRIVITEVSWSKYWVLFKCHSRHGVHGRTFYCKPSVWVLHSIHSSVWVRKYLERRQKEERSVSPDSSSQVNNTNNRRTAAWVFTATGLTLVSCTVNLRVDNKINPICFVSKTAIFLLHHIQFLWTYFLSFFEGVSDDIGVANKHCWICVNETLR